MYYYQPEIFYYYASINSMNLEVLVAHFTLQEIDLVLYKVNRCMLRLEGVFDLQFVLLQGIMQQQIRIRLLRRLFFFEDRVCNRSSILVVRYVSDDLLANRNTRKDSDRKRAIGVSV